MNAHVPSGCSVELWAHDWQSVLSLPPHAVSQQWESTQKPVAHWALFEHDWPVPEGCDSVRVSIRVVCRSGRALVYAIRVALDDTSESTGESSFSTPAEMANSGPLSTPLVPT